MKLLEASLNNSKESSNPPNGEIMNLNSTNLLINSNTPNDGSAFIGRKRKIRNKFTIEEDQKLRDLVSKYGDRSWGIISSLMENRSQRQCRERWKHYLSCDINESKKPWTKEEDLILILKYNELGPKWTKIARELPGRSDLQVKQRYFNHVKGIKEMETKFIETDFTDTIIPTEDKSLQSHETDFPKTITPTQNESLQYHEIDFTENIIPTENKGLQYHETDFTENIFPFEKMDEIINGEKNTFRAGSIISETTYNDFDFTFQLGLNLMHSNNETDSYHDNIFNHSILSDIWPYE